MLAGHHAATQFPDMNRQPRAYSLSFVRQGRYFGAVLLAVCLVAPPLLGWAWLSYQEYRLERTLVQRILRSADSSAFVQLRFAREAARHQLDWEHEGEFAYRGQMYDVVEVRETADSVFYRCWPDDAETALHRRLHAATARLLHHHPERRDRHQRLADFYQSLFVPPGRLRLCYTPPFEAGLGVATDYRWAQSRPQPATPPPLAIG
jgi:hypothetical protein